jgi:hypothetical protein
MVDQSSRSNTTTPTSPSVMAEHGLDDDESVIGFSFDGTGYGDDGAIWGGEVMLADYRAMSVSPISSMCRCRAATPRSSDPIARHWLICGRQDRAVGRGSAAGGCLSAAGAGCLATPA